MKWLLILNLLSPGAETPTVVTEVFESRAVCEQHAADVSRTLGVEDGDKTATGGTVMLQCVAHVAKA